MVERARHQRLKELFGQAVDLRPEQRADFVKEACDDDRVLLLRLEQLLSLHEDDDDGFIDEPLAVRLAQSNTSEVAAGAEDDLLSSEDAPTVVLGHKYELLKNLGHGGMGMVFEARHLDLGKHFAVKVLRSALADDPTYLDRFKAEARALGRLDHSNIVQVTDFGVDEKQRIPYLVMKRLEGTTMADHLANGARQSIETALPLLRQIASAIDHAHQAGVLHQDLKPSNVFLVDESAEEDSSCTVQIIDFGLSHLLACTTPVRRDEDLRIEGADMGLEMETEPTLVQRLDRRGSMDQKDSALQTDRRGSSGAVPGRAPMTSTDRLTAADQSELVVPSDELIGTPAYMAPEVIRGDDATPASDIYSFGVLIYRMLVGNTPFDGPPAALFAQHISEPPETPSSVCDTIPHELDLAILAALEKVPADRPASASMVVRGLEEAYQRSVQRRWREREIPRRLAATVAISLLAPLLAWLLTGPTGSLENKVIDGLFLASSPRPPADDLVLILIDEPTLSADPTPLVEMADVMGERLQDILRAGAVGIGIDLLLPDSWSNSAAFSNLLVHHPEKLVLAAYADEDGSVVGTGVVRGLTTGILGQQRTETLFGFVNSLPDSDGVMRVNRALWTDVSGNQRPSFAARAARVASDRDIDLPDGNYWIDYRIDASRVQRLSFKDLPGRLIDAPETFAGRFVLIGSDFAGSGDRHIRIPHPASAPSETLGTLVLALATQTLIDDVPLRSLDRQLQWALLSLLSLASTALLLLIRRHRRAVALSAVLALCWSALAMALFLTAGLVTAVVAPQLVLILVVVVGGTARYRSE